MDAVTESAHVAVYESVNGSTPKLVRGFPSVDKTLPSNWYQGAFVPAPDVFVTQPIFPTDGEMDAAATFYNIGKRGPDDVTGLELHHKSNYFAQLHLKSKDGITQTLLTDKVRYYAYPEGAVSFETKENEVSESNVWHIDPNCETYRIGDRKELTLYVTGTIYDYNALCSNRKQDTYLTVRHSDSKSQQVVIFTAYAQPSDQYLELPTAIHGGSKTFSFTLDTEKYPSGLVEAELVLTSDEGNKRRICQDSLSYYSDGTSAYPSGEVTLYKEDPYLGHKYKGDVESPVTLGIYASVTENTDTDVAYIGLYDVQGEYINQVVAEYPRPGGHIGPGNFNTAAWYNQIFTPEAMAGQAIVIAPAFKTGAILSIYNIGSDPSAELVDGHTYYAQLHLANQEGTKQTVMASSLVFAEYPDGTVWSGASGSGGGGEIVSPYVAPVFNETTTLFGDGGSASTIYVTGRVESYYALVDPDSPNTYVELKVDDKKGHAQTMRKTHRNGLDVPLTLESGPVSFYFELDPSWYRGGTVYVESKLELQSKLGNRFTATDTRTLSLEGEGSRYPVGSLNMTHFLADDYCVYTELNVSARVGYDNVYTREAKLEIFGSDVETNPNTFESLMSWMYYGYFDFSDSRHFQSSQRYFPYQTGMSDADLTVKKIKYAESVPFGVLVKDGNRYVSQLTLIGENNTAIVYNTPIQIKAAPQGTVSVYVEPVKICCGETVTDLSVKTQYSLNAWGEHLTTYTGDSKDAVTFKVKAATTVKSTTALCKQPGNCYVSMYAIGDLGDVQTAVPVTNVPQQYNRVAYDDVEVGKVKLKDYATIDVALVMISDATGTVGSDSTRHVIQNKYASLYPSGGLVFNSSYPMGRMMPSNSE